MAITLTPVDIGLLHSLLAYQPEAGHLAWRDPAYASRRAGRKGSTCEADRTQAGKVNGRRRVVTIRGHHYWASTLCWALHYGVWPANTPSAKNGLPDDLRITNLTLDSVPPVRGPGRYTTAALCLTPEQQCALNEAQAIELAMLNAKRLARYGTVHTSVRQDIALDLDPAPAPKPDPEDFF